MTTDHLSKRTFWYYASLCPWETLLGPKILTRFHYRSISSWPFANYFPKKFKLKNQVWPKYGNPDMQFLATLKIKIDIPRFLSFLSKKMRLNFIFRVAIYFSLAKTAHIWDPWKWKFVKNIKSHTTQIMSQVLSWLCTVQCSFKAV